MKYLAILFLIISLGGIAILGVAMFDHDMNSSNGGCVASTIDGTACPTSITGMALHHVSALQTFTKAIVPSASNWLLLLASLLFLSASVFLFHKNSPHPKLGFLPQCLRELSLNSSYSQRKIVSWLSLFELSPAL